MPRGDRTGPFSEGPQTGRRMGYCIGNEHPGFFYQHSNWREGQGRRFSGGPGYGRRHGTGFRHGYGDYYPGRPPDVTEKTMIENEIRILKDQLSALEDQLSKIEEK